MTCEKHCMLRTIGLMAIFPMHATCRNQSNGTLDTRANRHKVQRKKMDTSTVFGCKYCGRNNFASSVALKKHQATGFCARLKAKDGCDSDSSMSDRSWATPDVQPTARAPDYDDDLPWDSPPGPPEKPPVRRLEFVNIQPAELDTVTEQIQHLWDGLSVDEDQSSGDSGRYNDIGQDEDDASLERDPNANENADNATNTGISDSDSSATDAQTTLGPITWIRSNWHEYCEKAKDFRPLTEDQVNAIRLLHLLQQKDAAINTYDEVMAWHLRSTNKLRAHEPPSVSPHYIGRQTLLKMLTERYNYEHQFPYQRKLKLPVSGSFVRITCHNAGAAFQKLLTNPRINPQDYLFWDDNPLAGAPENLDYVQDVNTGLAYRRTRDELVTKEGEQVLGVILYCDGTAVSHFHDVEIIQLKIALGIMTREARMKDHCWATLGFIEKVHEQGGRGRNMLQEAQHLETQDGLFSEGSVNSVFSANGVGDKNDQDFHAMMLCVLEDYLQIQDRDFVWDQVNSKGEVTKDIRYKVFVPFVRADTKEADLFCGKFGQRSTTQQICRKCHVPLQRADDHLANYRLKTKTEIEKLVDKGDIDGLRKISQTYLRNAFHLVRFSSPNSCGIHGSCPSELLHAFLLGSFKYLRDIMFELLGQHSESSRLINALSKIYGKLFARQSDRTMPFTAFSKGINVGKLMAKDYRGVLLIMLAIFRSSKGRSILRKNRNFKKESDLDDWVLLLELMLEWESYLNEPKMYTKHVKRLEKKHRYIMYIVRKVARRQKGMGLKLMKFHAILHICQDIIEFGVPLEFDTSANEMHHKTAKKAARRTQRAAETFNFQTATRLVEYELVDLAMEEITTGRVPWDYGQVYEESESEEESEEESNDTRTGEARIKVHKDDNNEHQFEFCSRAKNKGSVTWSPDVIDFLGEMQDKIRPYMNSENIPIWTCHRRKGQIFRGHPNFRGKGPWRDWVWVNWGPGWGRLPSHIWCFVVLTGMPSGQNAIEFGGIQLKDGVFAVVETSNLEEDSAHVRSDLMMPVQKEVEFDANGNAKGREFYLADTEAFDEPCCVIPDIGGPKNRYFVVKPRNQWANEFILWIEDAHNLDQMDPIVNSSDEETEEDDEESGSELENEGSASEDGASEEIDSPIRKKSRS
jgi:hypothetical protein